MTFNASSPSKDVMPGPHGLLARPGKFADWSGILGAPFASRKNSTIVIEKRTLLRDCIVRALVDSCLDGPIASFDSVDDWLAAERDVEGQPLILLSTKNRNAAELKADCQRIAHQTDHRAVVALLAEDESAEYMIEALKDGVRGYIPTNVALRVAVEAIQLIRAGGIYVPAESLLRNMRAHEGGHESSSQRQAKTMFSGRQAAVVSALRKGTANKIIAHELNMAEGTVKVHIRNIMRKLKAKNRTHAAFLLTKMESSKW